MQFLCGLSFRLKFIDIDVKLYKHPRKNESSGGVFFLCGLVFNQLNGGAAAGGQLQGGSPVDGSFVPALVFHVHARYIPG